MSDDDKIMTCTNLKDYKIYLREILINFELLGLEMKKTKRKDEEYESYKRVKEEFSPEQNFFRTSFGGDRSSLFDSIELINLAMEMANITLEEVEKSLLMQNKGLAKKNEDINV